ncbi:MAG: extracellular solute-binding protein [Oscillospiraceae bacterium]|nr:extracellular solute-binding protein [Oscillospiraceae bacterium]
MKRNRLIPILLAAVMAMSAVPVAVGAAEASSDPVVLDVFLNHTWYPTDKFEGIIPETITEKTGVKLNATRAVDANQLGLMMASGDLPDIIFTDQELSRLSNDSLCYSYTDLIAQYAPEWKPSEMAIANATASSQDGKYYFLYSHAYTAEEYANATSGFPMSSSLLYRGDIAEELGFPADKLNTMDDLDALYAKVHETYPDMEVLVYGPVLNFGYFDIQWALTGNTSWVEKDDGTYVHTVASENYYNARKKLNEYFRLGYINPDSFAYDESTADGLIYTGGSFSYENATQGYAATFTEMGKAYNPDLKILEMKPLGEDAAYRLVHLGWAATFISKACKNPEAAIKLMEYLFSPEGARLTMWGREGIEYTLSEDGAPIFSDEWVEATKDEALFASKYNTNFYFGTTGLTEAIGRTAHLSAEYQDVYDLMRQKIVAAPWFGLAEPKDPNSDPFIQTEKLKELKENFDARLVMAESDAEFEKIYAELLDAARKIGLDSLTEYMNAEITRCKALYE